MVPRVKIGAKLKTKKKHTPTTERGKGTNFKSYPLTLPTKVRGAKRFGKSKEKRPQQLTLIAFAFDTTVAQARRGKGVPLFHTPIVRPLFYDSLLLMPKPGRVGLVSNPDANNQEKGGGFR